jgi:hypothetical protein
MSQTTELFRVKARIKALAEKTVSNGCTEAEAMAAAEMVGRLLERYALTMDEIELREARCVQKEIPLGGMRRRPIDNCVSAIARFCDCKVWVTRGAHASDPALTGLPRYVFFGFETDVALAAYLFEVIDRAIRTEVCAFRAANPFLRGVVLRRATTSFQQGMAARVDHRLDEMHRAREAAVSAQRSTGPALIVVKHRVVEDAFRETSIRLYKCTSRTVAPLPGAFQLGQAAGDRVNLNRPVAGDSRGLLS